MYVVAYLSKVCFVCLALAGIVNNTLRPSIPNWCDPGWRSLMEQCWSGDPSKRPTFSDVARELRAIAASMNMKWPSSHFPSFSFSQRCCYCLFVHIDNTSIYTSIHTLLLLVSFIFLKNTVIFLFEILFSICFWWMCNFVLDVHLCLFVLGIEEILPSPCRWIQWSKSKSRCWWWYCSTMKILLWVKNPVVSLEDCRCFTEYIFAHIVEHHEILILMDRCCLPPKCSWRILWCCNCGFFRSNRHIFTFFVPFCI